MHTWHWRTWHTLPYLTCSLLSDWSHGFFTRQTQPPTELVQALQPDAPVYWVKQVHGNCVLGTDAVQPTAPDRPAADGLFTHQINQAVWVCSADCTPVLIADAATGQVAALHAGWRGTALEIVPKAIACLQAQGSQLAHLRIALGPAIAGEVYQVSTEVAAQVGATVAPLRHELVDDQGAIVAADRVLDALRQFTDSPVLDDPKPGHARLDVRRVIALQLEQLGIAPEQVAIAPYCTYQDADLFFSYRRERQKKVQWSGIVSRG